MAKLLQPLAEVMLFIDIEENLRILLGLCIYLQVRIFYISWNCVLITKLQERKWRVQPSLVTEWNARRRSFYRAMW